MTIDTTCPDSRVALGAAAGLFDDDLAGAAPVDPAAARGWQALALAELGRPLTAAAAAATERLAAEHVVDLLFPGLSDAGRHEVLSALG